MLQAAVAAWAPTQPAIRAIIIVGSRVRDAYDPWSDLDLVIFTTDRDRYTAGSGWLSDFGAPWLTVLDEAGGEHPEWYALYDGGLKLDALLYRIDVESAALDLDALLASFPYQSVVARGITVLFDRLGTPRRIPPQPFLPSLPPTQDVFANLANGFLLDSVTAAKFISRGDLWRAQRWLAENLRPKLLTLIEWHAHGRDTWYSGRDIQSWADPYVLEALPRIFPAYEQASMKQALLAVMNLFQTLGEETAARFGFTYPTVHQRVVSLIQSILNAPATNTVLPCEQEDV